MKKSNMLVEEFENIQIYHSSSTEFVAESFKIRMK